MQGQSSTWVSSIYSLLGDARVVFTAAVLLRVSLLEYGYWQDHYSAVKYTDIDYFVFTDAARNVAQGQSPYLRDTYRYTPLLAWLLVPTTWSNAWFAFGKVLFSAGDILTGWLMTVILRDHGGMSNDRAIRLSTIWLLNPMVATISTRGSSEGLLAVMVMALLWAALQRRVLLAGFFLGLGVHFKIYPFVYAVSIAWWLDSRSPNVVEARKESSQVSISSRFKSLMTPARITFAVSSAATFAALNGFMFLMCVEAFASSELCNRAKITIDTVSHSWSIHSSIILFVQITDTTSRLIVPCYTNTLHCNPLKTFHRVYGQKALPSFPNSLSLHCLFHWHWLVAIWHLPC